MKTNRLLEKLMGFMNSERREQIAKYESIKRILKKLKKKENDLKEKLKNEQDKEVIKQLQKEMAVLHAQRKKGVKLRKELKEAKKTSNLTAQT